MIIHLLVKCRSEGPAQVFLLVLTWLITAFGHMSRTDWKKIVFAYDNMCHLNNLRVAQSPLPLPGKLKFIWNDTHKIIDDFHLKNHKDPRCAQNYSSTSLRDDILDMNRLLPGSAVSKRSYVPCQRCITTSISTASQSEETSTFPSAIHIIEGLFSLKSPNSFNY